MKDKFDRQIRELQDKVEERKEQEDECLNLNVWNECVEVRERRFIIN